MRGGNWTDNDGDGEFSDGDLFCLDGITAVAVSCTNGDWRRAGNLLFNRDWSIHEHGPNPAAPEGFHDRCDGPRPGKT